MQILFPNRRCLCTSIFAGLVFATIAMAQESKSDKPMQPLDKNDRDKILVLPSFEVKDADERGYIGTNSLSATSAAIPVTDLPFSITVLTRQVLDDTGAHQLMNLSEFVSGMQSYDRPYDDTESMTLRGFNAIVATDGQQTLGEVARDTGIMERIEVLKGASAILFPQGGSPGGTINVITKSPQDKEAGYIKVQAGQYNANRVELDYNGAPVANGKLLYRVVLVDHDADAFSENEFTKRTIFFPSISYKFTDNSKVTLKYEHLKQTSASPTGQGLGPHGEDDPAHPYFDFSLPRSRSFDDPNYNRYEKTDDRIWTSLESKVSDAFQFRTGLQAAETDDSRNGTRPKVPSGGGPLIAADGTVQRIYFDPHWHQYDYLAFVDTTTVFSLFKTNHTVLLGTSYTVNKGTKNSPPNSPFPSTNAYAPPVPIPAGSLPLPPAVWNPDGSTFYTKAYLMDVIKAWDDRITVNLGITQNWFEGQSWHSDTNLYDIEYHHQDAKQYGLMIQPVKDVFFYASYNENFSPSNNILGVVHPDGTVTAGARAPSQFNTSKEVGVKLRMLDGRLSFNAAAYKIALTNRTENILNSEFAQLLTSGTSQGFEADVLYALNNNVTFIGTVAHINAKDNEGFRFTDIPTQTASGWVRYDFRSGSLKGFGVAAGFTYCDSMQNHNHGVLFNYSGRTLFNVGVYYDLKPLKFQLNVSNLFDKDYFGGGSPPTITYRGEPRNIQGSVTYSF